MKKYIIPLSLLVVIIAIFAGYMIFKPQSINIPEGAKDCGSEENVHGQGYDPSIRDCFYEAFQICEPAKIYQKIYTIEGDPFETTAIIVGKENNRCKVHVYVDSRDNFGFYGKYDMSCYNVQLDERNDRNFLIIDECDSNRSSYI